MHCNNIFDPLPDLAIENPRKAQIETKTIFPGTHFEQSVYPAGTQVLVISAGRLSEHVVIDNFYSQYIVLCDFM